MLNIRRAAVATLFVALSASAALADPPTRVGRLSYTEGTVSFHTGDQDQWSQASANYPITTGDAFWTEPDSRSEIQVGSLEIRMDQSTALTIEQLDDSGTRIEVPQGVVNVHLRAAPLGGHLAVDTPVGEIDLVEPGSYHIDAGQPQGDTPSDQVRVTTLEGKLQIQGPRSRLEVMPGETAAISGNPPSYDLEEGNAEPFDDWALSRERREAQSQSLQYVSPHMTGYEDLDQNGQWSNDPEYGAVWYPSAVAVDWAPYRYGHWAFVVPWGWTWVDDAPWGFAPFHYGRWAQRDNRWCWVPGRRIDRPVYAPALVAFIGGRNWSIGISSGPAVGWVPLGPREAFHPYYQASSRYTHNVNVTNVNITVNEHGGGHYMNQHAATVVPSGSFTHGTSVHNSRMNVSADALDKAPQAATLDQFKPAPEARRGGQPLSAAATAHLPRPAVTRKVEQEAHSPQAPVNHMQMKGAAPGPHAAPAPISTTAETPPRHATPTENPVNVTRPPATQYKTGMPEIPGPGPGPAVRPHAATPIGEEGHAPSVMTTRPAAKENAVSRDETGHPQQNTRITPTPKGWQRTPVERQQPAAESAPASMRERPQPSARPVPDRGDATPDNSDNGRR